MFSESERRCGVEVAVKSNQITQRGECIVYDDVHVSNMYLLYCGPPHLNIAEVLVENGQVEGRILIVAPWTINERRACYVDALQISAQFSQHPEHHHIP